ncbi:hypothetical protein KLP40_18605 [Hymenobacter sp. NST-14]|uniref:hypothetical protein n=1 Tax=Hymenobacter piscis TaxID=2839984 RepID=UPI001C015AA1|nr:hypothetical protein [Hymenobacter piscis]MBT9395186.1 hypothetical protein [Hymenobacter piscis]
MNSFARSVFVGGLLSAGALFTSCSRDAMPTMEEGLVGRWEWEQTAAKNQHVLTPDNTGHKVVVEFDRRGRARFYQDDKLVSAAAFMVRRDRAGLGEPVRHLIIYRGYQNNQYYSVSGNRLQLQDANGKLLQHQYTRLVADLSVQLPTTKQGQ